MSQSIITNAFSPWLAERLAQDKPARPDKMLFAWIEGRDENTPIDPEEVMPGEAEIRYPAEITQFGTLNESAFVCSVVLDTTIGDWDYNWIGLIDSETDTLLMVVHPGVQRKLKTSGQNQGNTLTRNLMMQFAGAAAASQITVTAETWQIDFSARLAGMDESHRRVNMDYYGDAAFLNEGFQVTGQPGGYLVAPGLGYVKGVRCRSQEAAAVAAAGPVKIWLDVTWQGTVTGPWASSWAVRAADALEEYERDGFAHYVTAIAEIHADGTITDLRPPFPLQALEQVVDEIDVWSRDEADARFLQCEKNLSDLTEAETARDNLDVFSRDEGDERYLRAENNLSDLTDAAQAREALGIGDANGDGFRAIVDAILYPGITIQSDVNPAERFGWQQWESLAAQFDGRALRVGWESGHVGGNNAVQLSASHLPDHVHRAGLRAPGEVWDDGVATVGTDNQKGQYRHYTAGTYAPDLNPVKNAPLDVTNAYVTGQFWKRVG